MKKASVLLVCALLLAPVWATEPGQPLGCSDCAVGIGTRGCRLVMPKQQFIQFLSERLRAIFSAYNKGLDVSPALRFQVEGIMQTGMALSMVSRSELDDLLKCLYQQVFDTAAPESLQAPYIPPLMKRAPVRPTTKD